MATVTLFISFDKLSGDSKKTFPTDRQLLTRKFKNLKFDPFLIQVCFMPQILQMALTPQGMPFLYKCHSGGTEQLNGYQSCN